ncbi:MAG TPA: cytochrome c, partial [Ottowia sp.]|nr:cytochrome c [Ottowia sp.]
PRIAQHEQPPAAEKVRILGWLGSDAARFRSLDGEVEHAAMALGEAARRGDGPAVIAAFGKIQHSCLACHQSYRKAFVEQFYGRR